MLRASSRTPRDFSALKRVLFVGPPSRRAPWLESFVHTCPETDRIEAATLAEARDAAREPLSVVLGVPSLPDGDLTELAADLPVVALVSAGNEELGLAAVQRGALDWAVVNPDILPHVALGAVREWREHGLRRVAEAQLRHADRLSIVGRIAAHVIHELGTPLNVVRMRAQLLAMDASNVDATTRIIIEQCDRMTTLLRTTLNLSRSTTEGRCPTELRAVVDRAVLLLAPAIRRQGTRLSVEGSAEPQLADPGALLQVVLNLIDNAMDAIGQGGHISITVGPGTIAVSDDGAGIQPEHIPHLFAPFFTTKEPNEGTGIGLAVSGQIARDHGGRIAVRSTPGQGSTFTLHLS